MKRICPTPWLGSPHGYLSDWVTQRWVQLTGRYIDLEHDENWLGGPSGKPTGIGADFFKELAVEEVLLLQKNRPGSGLIQNFSALNSLEFEAAKVQPEVVEFYEHTADYDLDAWGEWCGVFRPFGTLLAVLFSRRLQQLNLPLSSLDTSRGLTSDIVELVEPETGRVRYTAWMRRIVRTGNVLYAGSYSVERVPGQSGPCVKVVFPLPNGSAIVLMKTQVHEDGSFSVVSSGEKFGEAGFYFVARNPNGRISARYLRAMRERIHVYAAEVGTVRADHTLKLWGLTFLRLHYRLRKKTAN